MHACRSTLEDPTAIGYAEGAARGEAESLPAALLDDLYGLADQVSGGAGYAGFAAAHAARVGARSIGGAADHSSHLEIIASAYGTTRVLYSASGGAAEPAINAALRGDFDSLLRLDLGSPGAVGRGVDPSATGPLGPLDRRS